jgi:hypothetical protein
VTNIPPVPEEKPRVEEVFTSELRMIKDDKIRQFVIDVFEELCPDYFWTVPCSTSGKYHPQFALGKGGLVRHVKSAVWWGIELSRALEMEQYHDEMVAALLLHDLIKNGKGLDANGYPLERGVTGTHGVTLANKINNKSLDHELISCPPEIEIILTGIASHMGIWTTSVEDRPENLIENGHKAFAKLIHLADYCASRKVDELIVTLTKEKTND